MANMSSSDRAQYERADLAGPDRSMRVSNRKPVIGFTVLALVLLGLLAYATLAGIDNWWQALVLGVIALTAVGLMIAVSPRRRG
jgi:fatty acid desaturase